MIIPSPTALHPLRDTLSLAATTLPTTDMSVAASLLTVLIRGGSERFIAPSTTSAAAAAMDLGRVRMRLEGIQLYATLTALLTNSCLRLHSSVPKQNKKGSSRAETIARDIFYLCTSFSILSGSYTTIVFGLLSLYSKTELGRGLDAPFLEFWAATCAIRESVIESFLCAWFEVGFILSLLQFFNCRRGVLFVAFAFFFPHFRSRDGPRLWFRLLNFCFHCGQRLSFEKGNGKAKQNQAAL